MPRYRLNPLPKPDDVTPENWAATVNDHLQIGDLYSGMSYDEGDARRKARESMDAAFTQLIAAGQDDIARVVCDMLLFVPEGGFPMEEGVYGESREELADAPFFSEAYLYALMGKDQARTVLSFIGALCRALGYEHGTYGFIQAHVEQLKPILEGIEE